MRPEAESFLDVVLPESSGNAEQRLAARGLLGGQLDPSTPPEVLDIAGERIRHRRTSRAWWWLAVLPFLATIVWLGLPYWQVHRQRSYFDPHTWELVRPETALQRQVHGADRRLLFGDLDQPKGLDRWRWLDSDDPAEFAEFVRRSIHQKGHPPEGFLDKAHRIDPGNGWWEMIAAAVRWEEAIDTDMARTRKREDAQYPVRSEAELRESIDLLRAASAAPRFTSHEATMRERRYVAIPAPRQLLEHILSFGPVYSPPFGIWSNAKADRLLQAAMDHQSGLGDIDEVEELARLRLRLTGRALENSTAVVETIRIDGFIQDLSGPRARLPDGFDDARVSAFLDREMDYRKLRGGLPDPPPVEQLIRDHGSQLFATIGRNFSTLLVDFPPLDPALLKPTRRMEHAIFAQVMLVGFGLLCLLVAITTTILGRSRSTMLTGVSRRLSRALDQRDLLGVFLLAWLLPIAAFLLLRHLTPLGGLAWNPDPGLTVSPAGWLGLFVVVIVLSSRMLGSRLKARLPMTFAAESPWLARLTLASAGAVIACGDGRWIRNLGVDPLLPAWGFAGFGLLGLVAMAISCRFGAPGEFVRRIAIGESLRQLLLGALLICSLLLVTYRGEERHWFAQETLMRMTPTSSVFEDLVMEQMKRELREVIGRSPAP